MLTLYNKLFGELWGKLAFFLLTCYACNSGKNAYFSFYSTCSAIQEAS